MGLDRHTGIRLHARAVASSLVDRIRSLLSPRTEVDTRRMFGGHCFLFRGHMVCGVTKDGTLMVRVGPEAYEKMLKAPGARPMDFTGRPMRGFVYVDASAIATARGLRTWVERGLRFAETLPLKVAGRAKTRRSS